MLRTLIQATALIVTLIASFFWIRGSISLTAKDMASLARTFYGYNSTVVNNLAMQKADSLIAAFLLLMSFILQGVNMAWPMRFDDFAVDKKGLVWAIIVSFFIFVLSYWGSTLLSKHYVAEAQILLQKPKP
jgi:hypothetical protein